MRYTPELLEVLRVAADDNQEFIKECLENINFYDPRVRKDVLDRVERRRQLLAITRDILIRAERL